MSESLHTPIHAETELRCDDCNVLLGYMQEYEDTFNSPCPECDQDYADTEAKILCSKCRMVLG